MLTSFNPLTRGIDLAVRLDSRDHGRSRNVDLTGPLDDPLESGTDISTSFVNE